MKIKIDSWRDEDIESINNVYYRSWLDTYPNENEGVTIEDIKENFKSDGAFTEKYLNEVRENIKNAPKTGKLYLSAKDGDDVVGVMSVKRGEEYNTLMTIYILPEYQGVGIGTMLWQKAKEFLDENKPTRVEVVDYGEQAIKFYEKLGFVKTGKIIKDKQNPLKSGYVFTDIEMVRPADRQ